MSKREVGNPQISSAETVNANFGFYRPEAAVRTLDPSAPALAPLLLGFFHFYLSIFDPERHAISISHETSLIDKAEYRKELMERF